ncbi:type III pantothenate kinase [Flavobacterium sp. SM15]|uniref:type III pantothenate kinase n=1 Tax=Flavobacterium sp. SM15 TaxID=2908005 RepID=UPI001EDB2E66|nr:type III pantothenate kinase [Flavobacterium sp. SM15]MCG2609983.1 type III pantothenate kinase [Flavobacterium sp. SM15]
MLLTVDVGNTRIKVAVFEKDSILMHAVFLKDEAEKKIENIFKNFSGITFSVFSSVGKLDESVLNLLRRHSNLNIISSETHFPFQNKYETPKTLGVDRMVLASGATLLFPEQHRLIIDAGTCITYDFVDAQNNYLGGAISPGFRLRYESLHNYTAKLPLLTLEQPEGFIGNSTKESIHSGVVNGIVNEIEGFIERYRQEYQHLTVILTGGDAEFLAKNIKSTIFANSNFLLESLNHLHNYISDND